MGKDKKPNYYKYKTKPYAHQVKALKKLISNGWGGALLMEPRTGKTKVAIDYASILHLAGHVNRVMVFCPNGVLGVWENEIPLHCPVPHRVVIWDKRARKQRSLPPFGRDVLDFVVVNYEASAVVADWRRYRSGPHKGEVAWFMAEGRKNVMITPEEAEQLGAYAYRLRSKSVGGRHKFRKDVVAWQPQLMILDESHRIKSPTATKSRFFHWIGPKIPYRVGMTGTVVTKKKRIYDVFSQWLFLNPKRFVDGVGKPMTFGEFKAEFSVIRVIEGNTRSWPKWIRNRNEGKLHKLMHKDAYSVLREDCFDMPPLTKQVIPVHLDESADVYDQMAEDMVARIRTGEITEASIVLVQGMRLRQISGGVARTVATKEHPKGRLRVIGSEKLDVLQDRLEDLMEAGEHVIVGASFRADTARIQRLCKKHGWRNFLVQGGVKRHERDRMVKEFNEWPDGAVFIGNPQAAGEGIDLRSAAIMIWYSLPRSWVDYQQFCDRNALHSGPRFQEYLLADGVDYLIYQGLQEDGDVAKMMITSPKRLLRGA